MAQAGSYTQLATIAEDSSNQSRKSLEQEKWDSYYASLPLSEADEMTHAFNLELTTHISALLPAGSRILEAGCGGGWQSLELARTGNFHVTLMDFSVEALNYARRLFAREQVTAEFRLGDVFAPGDEPEFDLVFNAGVLEHYSLERQAAFLGGMASRSRNLILALAPNRACYWYWLWRIQKAGEGQWPFGKEMPMIDFATAFKAAGVQFLGQAFMGQSWAELFISSLTGLERQLSQEIINIHRSPLIPAAQRSYLLAGLGSVATETPALPAPWQSSSSPIATERAEETAALADALALRINAEHKLQQLQAQLIELQQTPVRAQNQIAQRLEQEIAEKEQIIATREAGITWLREELAATYRQARTERETALAAQQQLHDQSVAALRAELRAAEQAAQALRDQVTELEKVIYAREEALTWLRAELADARQQIAQTVAVNTQQQDEQARLINDLQAELQSQTQAVQALQERVAQLQQPLHEQDQAVDKFHPEGEAEQVPHEPQEEMEKFRKMVSELQAELRAHEQAVQVLKEQVVEKERIIQARDEGIAWLRGELAARFTLAQATFPLRHPLTWLALQDGYWRLRRRVKRRLAPLLPSHFNRAVKAIFHHSSLPANPLRPVEQPTEERAPLPVKAQETDFFKALTLLPRPREEELPALLEYQTPAKPLQRADVICFSIIDWETRYQRPQQIMSQYAAHGHRVFYLSTTRFLPPDATPRYAVRQLKENVYEVQLAAQRMPDVYGEAIGGANQASLLESLEELRQAFRMDEAIAYVMIASWGNVALDTQRQWGWRTIYDCMDEWENFPGIKRPILDMELRLVKDCDLLVVTAQRLYEKWRPYNRPTVLARNAADYHFYAQHFLPNNLLAETSQPIVGYYGAIADWFDVELMAHVAAARPNYTFVLLGGVFDVDVSALQALPNVRLLGQQPYETMPQYLYHFDACLIPFKVNPITEATDPVKLYEYFSGGKPVVSVAMPEVEQYREYLYIAADKDDFVTKLDAAVSETNEEMRARRRALARQNSWEARYQQITTGLAEVTPRASIIIVTYNNLALNKLCLESIIRNTEYPNYEIIVVDNNSTDGTPDYLRYMASMYANLHVILNTENYGFARANNQGLARSTGEYLVLLNNDTIVPPGWLSRLLRHLRRPQIGMVGPLTNFVGNEAKIEVPYQTWGEMEQFAKEYTWRRAGEIADIHMLAMFCVAFRRATFEAVGPLDEQFGIGMFEDDDYAQRVRAQKLRVVCAADVFVHHFGQAAFKKLIENGQYNALFEENRRRYESKWNVSWIPRGHAQVRFKRV